MNQIVIEPLLENQSNDAYLNPNCIVTHVPIWARYRTPFDLKSLCTNERHAASTSDELSDVELQDVY